VKSAALSSPFASFLSLSALFCSLECRCQYLQVPFAVLGYRQDALLELSQNIRRQISVIEKKFWLRRLHEITAINFSFRLLNGENQLKGRHKSTFFSQNDLIYQKKNYSDR